MNFTILNQLAPAHLNYQTKPFGHSPGDMKARRHSKYLDHILVLLLVVFVMYFCFSSCFPRQHSDLILFKLGLPLAGDTFPAKRTKVELF